MGNRLVKLGTVLAGGLAFGVTFGLVVGMLIFTKLPNYGEERYYEGD